MNDEERDALSELAQALVKDANLIQKAKLDLEAMIAVQLMKESYEGCDDDTLALFAQTFSVLITSLARLPVSEAGDTMNAMVAAYTLAAAALAGVYEIGPVSKAAGKKAAKKMTDHRQSPFASPDPLRNTGLYL